MRSCTLLCDSSRLLIYHKSEPRTPVLSESGALGILVRAFPVLQHHRTYLLSYTPRVRDRNNGNKSLQGLQTRTRTIDHKDQDKDKDLTPKDKEKDLTPKDKDKDLKNFLKD